MFKTGDRIDAEDITTDVFLRMLESIGSFKFQGYPFSSWLFRIAHNLIVDHFRRKSRRQAAPLEDAMAVASGSPSDMDHKIDVDLSVAEVYGAMDDLTGPPARGHVPALRRGPVRQGDGGGRGQEGERGQGPAARRGQES